VCSSDLSGSSEVFTDEALSLICRYAKGIPLTINTLCSNALSLGCGLYEKRVSPTTVKKVRGIKEILTDERVQVLVSGIKKSVLRKISSIVLAIVILAMALFFGWTYVQPIFNTIKPNPSVTPPANIDTVKVVPPEIKPHGIVENVPVSSSPQMKAPPTEAPKIPVSPTPDIAQSNAEIRIKEIVEVKQGVNLYSLAYQHYKATDETLIDHILKLNPEIKNPNLIMVSQKIKIPEIMDSLLMVQYPDGLYKVHLRTFTNLKSAGQYKRDVGSMGKEIEIVPWKVSPGETWYRVMAGPFASRDEALKALQEMKQKGFSILPSSFRAHGQ
jgi:hypothetical protein